VVKMPIELEEKGSVGSNEGCNTPAYVPVRLVVPPGYCGPPLIAKDWETVRTRQRREPKSAFTIQRL
jgi:hypothetical protein